MRQRFGQASRVLVGAGALAAGLVLAPLASHHARAFYGVCLDDPMVFLGGPLKVTIASTTQTDPSNVQAIQYTLHVPAGTTIDHIVYQGNHDGTANVTVVADDAANSYDLDTFITSSQSVTVSTSLQVGTGSSASAAQAGGQTNQDILTGVQH